jgi:hypothetical protein
MATIISDRDWVQQGKNPFVAKGRDKHKESMRTFVWEQSSL